VEADVFNADGSPANIHLVSTSEQRIHATWPHAFAAILRALPHELGPAQCRCPARHQECEGPGFFDARSARSVTQFNTSTGNDRFSLAAVAVSNPEGEFAFAAGVGRHPERR